MVRFTVQVSSSMTPGGSWSFVDTVGKQVGFYTHCKFLPISLLYIRYTSVKGFLHDPPIYCNGSLKKKKVPLKPARKPPRDGVIATRIYACAPRSRDVRKLLPRAWVVALVFGGCSTETETEPPKTKGATGWSLVVFSL